MRARSSGTPVVDGFSPWPRVRGLLSPLSTSLFSLFSLCISHSTSTSTRTWPQYDHGIALSDLGKTTWTRFCTYSGSLVMRLSAQWKVRPGRRQTSLLKPRVAICSLLAMTTTLAFTICPRKMAFLTRVVWRLTVQPPCIVLLLPYVVSSCLNLVRSRSLVEFLHGCWIG